MTKRLGPGVWVDAEGALHFSIPELLEMIGLPATAENQEWAADLVREIIQREAPQAEVIEQSACPDCGLGGLGLHKPGCPLRAAQ
jgi:hypothetical protein